MSKVFICSPFSGGITTTREQNITTAKIAGRYAYEKGKTPFIPHLMYPTFLNDDAPEERYRGIGMGMEFMRDCSELWIFTRKFTSDFSGRSAAAQAIQAASIPPIEDADDRINELIKLGWEITKGMAAEIEFANKLGLDIVIHDLYELRNKHQLPALPTGEAFGYGE